jgi:hypothetical protein
MKRYKVELTLVNGNTVSMYVTGEGNTDVLRYALANNPHGENVIGLKIVPDESNTPGYIPGVEPLPHYLN